MQSLNPKKTLTVIGAGGHARALIALLSSCNLTASKVIDASAELGENILGVPVVNAEVQDSAAHGYYVLAIGSNTARKRALSHYKGEVYAAPLIHPSAILAMSPHIGRFCQIFAGAYIGPQAQIGDNVILNTYAIVEHEVSIGDDCHIAVGAKILGRAKVGHRCFIGAGAVIKDGVSVCDDVTIGANSFVNEKIDKPGTYVGSPARQMKK